MIFGHGYVFGIFMLSAAGASLALWQVPLGVGLLYAAYSVRLLGLNAGLTYTILLGGLATAAWFAAVSLAEDLLLPPWALVLSSFGVMLLNFFCLLLGHRAYEEFQAPPLFFHGFVAAPPLEWITFLYRVGICRTTDLEELDRECSNLRTRVKEARSTEHQAKR